MKTAGYRSLAIAVGLASSVSTIAMAQAQGVQGVIGNLGKNDSIFVDGRTFNVMAGRPKADTDLRQLSARELGPGAIIFRYEDKLYIADGSDRVMAYLTDPEIERQRPHGLRADVDIERQRPQGLRADVDIERQRPQGLRADVDIERQRPQGLRDTDIERQRPQGLRADVDIERQRPQGLRADVDIERQRPQGLRADVDVERQRPQGLRADVDVERQRPLGLRDSDIERQRPLGLSDADIERQRALGFREATVGSGYRVYINDPDYAYYRLKKTFEENWNAAR